MFKLRARKRIVASLLAIGALALATVLGSATAPPAQAAVPCPTTDVANITSWDTAFSQRGITLCEGYAGPSNVVKVQIVDIAAGARLQVLDYGGRGAPNPADNELLRRFMPTWASDVGIRAPAPGAAFSVTNASFFTSTTTDYTKLSLPYRLGSFGSHGVAIYGTDPNSSTPKRVLRYDHSGENIEVAPFPTFYSASDAQCLGWAACLVGFDPLSDPSGNPSTTESRTFVGIDAQGVNVTRAYILTGVLMTVATADRILKHVGASATMQLDGGGSTGMQSYAGHWLQAPLSRAVPNVLFVRYG